VRSDGTEFEYLHKLENWMSTTSIGPTKHTAELFQPSSSSITCVIVNNT